MRGVRLDLDFIRPWIHKHINHHLFTSPNNTSQKVMGPRLAWHTQTVFCEYNLYAVWTKQPTHRQSSEDNQSRAIIVYSERHIERHTAGAEYWLNTAANCMMLSTIIQVSCRSPEWTPPDCYLSHHSLLCSCQRESFTWHFWNYDPMKEMFIWEKWTSRLCHMKIFQMCLNHMLFCLCCLIQFKWCLRTVRKTNQSGFHNFYRP